MCGVKMKHPAYGAFDFWRLRFKFGYFSDFIYEISIFFRYKVEIIGNIVNLIANKDCHHCSLSHEFDRIIRQFLPFSLQRASFRVYGPGDVVGQRPLDMDPFLCAPYRIYDLSVGMAQIGCVSDMHSRSHYLDRPAVRLSHPSAG